MTELTDWLLLLKAPLVGVQTFYKALTYFETPKNVFTSTASMRKRSGIFKEKTLAWFNKANASLVEPDLIWQNDPDCHILTLLDKQYPQLLKEIAMPPPILYVRGQTNSLNTPQVAMVGSRNPTPSGIECAQQLTKQLVKHGLTITSGLASGIDATAHLSALDIQGKTIAVCGTGLDRVYPAKHKNLAHQITRQGALISEFPIGTPPVASNFPKRNRLISGLSLGTLVVEATIKSGSLITARLAAEQGREVFAIPSSIYNANAKGCHYLIKQGAILTESVDDILDNIKFDVPKQQTLKNNHTIIKKVNTKENILLKYLTYAPMTIDDLVSQSNLNVQQVSQALLELELSGIVQNVASAGFSLK